MATVDSGTRFPYFLLWIAGHRPHCAWKNRSLNARKGELTKTKAELEKALEELKADLATQTANRAEEKVRAEYEAKAKKQAEKEAAIEPSLASAGNGGLKSSDWSGPTPLDDILK